MSAAEYEWHPPDGSAPVRLSRAEVEAFARIGGVFPGARLVELRRVEANNPRRLGRRETAAQPRR